MQKTSKLEMNLFEDSDVFHVNDLNDNINIINHTAPQKSTLVTPSYYTRSVATWSYYDSDYYPVPKSMPIDWNIGKFLGDRYAIFQSFTCTDVMLMQLGDGYGPFATQWPIGPMPIKIYMPPGFSETNQITNVHVVPICSSIAIWLTSIYIGKDDDGLYIKPIIMAPKVKFDGQVVDPFNRFEITFNVYSEIHGSGYDGTLGMDSILPTMTIQPSTFNSFFSEVGSDVRSSRVDRARISIIDSGYLVYRSELVSTNINLYETYKTNFWFYNADDYSIDTDGMLFYITPHIGKKTPFISVSSIGNGKIRLRATLIDGESRSSLLYNGKFGFIKYQGV